MARRRRLEGKHANSFHKAQQSFSQWGVMAKH